MNFFLSHKYHSVIVLIYTFLCCCFFFFTKSPLALFVFSGKDFVTFLWVSVAALITLLVASRLLHFCTIGINKKSLERLPLHVVYASVLIALPEEIFFRGIVQLHLDVAFSNPSISIILSSAIFGLAHALNGSKGVSPADWNWKLIVMTFLAGLFFGTSFYVTSSLVVPIALHALLILLMKCCTKEPIPVS